MIAIGLIILSIPFVYGIFLLAAQKYRIPVVRAVSPVVYGICFILSLILLFSIDANDNLSIQSAASSVSSFKLIFTLTAGRFSAVILSLASLITFCISVFSVNHVKNENADSSGALLAFSLFGISGVALSGNILVLFIFSEIIGLVSYLILNSERKRLYLVKALIINSISDLAFLLGILLIFSVTGSFDIEDIKNAVESGMLSWPLFSVSGACLLAGVMAKSAVFPLHIWLTTNDKISNDSENIFLSLSMLPAGILLAIRLTPVLEPGVLNAMVCFGAANVIYGLLLSGFSDSLRDTLRRLAISHTGLMFIAIGTSNSVYAVILLGAVSISQLALLQSYQLIEERSNRKLNILYFWLFFSSAISYAGLPLSSMFLSYAGIMKNFLSYNVFPGLNIAFTLFVFCICSQAAFSTFKFVFRINRREFENFSISIFKNVKYFLGIAVLLFSSLFIWISINPVNASFLWLPGYLNLTNFVASVTAQSASVPNLDSLLVLLSTAFGIMASYYIITKKETFQKDQSRRFNGLEPFFDNAFAGLFIKKEDMDIENPVIDLSALTSRLLKFDGPGAYISFSLLLIVIFYFIFRTM